jgi:predicted RNase H-like HicB family nuclease
MCHSISNKFAFAVILRYIKQEPMSRIDLKVAVWKEGKHYVSQCLNVEVASFGKTKKEALEKLKEALELYFEDAKPSAYTKVDRPDVVSLTLQHA